MVGPPPQTPQVAEQDGLSDLSDLPTRVLEEIEHFFSIYKDLEPESTLATLRYTGCETAMLEVEASRLRFGRA